MMKKLRNHYTRFRFWAYDIALNSKFLFLPDNNSRERLDTVIDLRCHVLEKGLSMPDMRFGFGRDNLCRLIDTCLEYLDKFGKDSDNLRLSASLAAKYREVHSAAGFTLDQELADKIESLISLTDAKAIELPHSNAMAYFARSESPFPEFVRSRRSIRHFGHESISIERITDAVSLAMSAPSSCNRQATRVHLITDPELLKNTFLLHNGSKGFNQEVDKLLIITSDLNCYRGISERNLPFIDSGMFAQNLLLSLHYFHIAACTLNWCASPENDDALHKLCAIEECERISLLIACGSVPDEDFPLTVALRKSAENIMTIH